MSRRLHSLGVHNPKLPTAASDSGRSLSSFLQPPPGGHILVHVHYEHGPPIRVRSELCATDTLREIRRVLPAHHPRRRARLLISFNFQPGD